MAITLVDTQQSVTTNGTRPSITFSGAAVNDLAVMLVANGNREAAAVRRVGGSTTGIATASAAQGGTESLQAAVVVALISDTGAVSFESTVLPDTNDGWVLVGYLFRGVNVSNFAGASYLRAASRADGNSTNPNPPSITATAGDAFVVAAASRVSDATKTLPAGFGDEIDVNGAGSSDPCSAGMGWKSAAGGSEDPAAFGSWSSGDWSAHSVALIPAPPGNPWYYYAQQ